MKLSFVWVGRTKDAAFHSLEERYLRRIRHFYPVSRAHVPEARRTDSRQLAAQLEREARKLEKKINPAGYLICLDEKGEQMSSRRLAALVEKLMEQGIKEIVFLVGGPWGVAERLRAQARRRLSLSRMTLPHELARVVLLEQIYRAATIMKGLPYHR